MKQAYFDTLQEALASECLEDYWQIYFEGIDYGQTFRFKGGMNNDILISIYRSNTGRYERPIHYKIN